MVGRRLATTTDPWTHAGAQGGASSDDEDMLGAPPARAAAAAAAVAAGGEAGDVSGGVAEEDREFIATLNEVGGGSKGASVPSLVACSVAAGGKMVWQCLVLMGQLPLERYAVRPQDLGNINAYFMEKEEEAVIRLRALQDRLAAAKATAAHPGAPAGSAAAAAAAADASAGEGGSGGTDAAGAPPAELEKLRSEVSCHLGCDAFMHDFACLHAAARLGRVCFAAFQTRPSCPLLVTAMLQLAAAIALVVVLDTPPNLAYPVGRWSTSTGSWCCCCIGPWSTTRQVRPAAACLSIGAEHR